MGFFTAKRLLIGAQFKQRTGAKLLVEDVLWVAENVEPRVYEVLPAALIRFPKTFIGKGQLPKVVKRVVAAIERNEQDHPGYFGFEYCKMLHWANKPLPDKRTVPVIERKKNKTFRFSPIVLTAMKTLAEKSGLSETALIEQLVSQALVTS